MGGQGGWLELLVQDLPTKLFASKDNVHSSQKIARARLHDVTRGTGAKGFSHHISRRFLAYEQYPRLGGEPMELSSGLNSI